MSASALAEKILESDRVRRWRVEELERAGYPPAAALVLGDDPEVDLHVAVGLLGAGCPIETAMRILL
jgi:hypothetical protein